MMHRNPSMHCFHPALSLILHQQTVVCCFFVFSLPFLCFYFHLFPFPTVVSLLFFKFFIVFLFSQYYVSFTFVFFCWFLLFLFFLFCASPPGVSFFCILSISLLIFYFLSFALIFLFFSFPSYISNFFYVLCVCCSSFFPFLFHPSVLFSQTIPFLFSLPTPPPAPPLASFILPHPPLVSTLLSPSSYCTWCSAIRADSSLSFLLSLLPSPHSPSPPSVHPSLSTLCRLGFRQASSYQATGEMLIGFISGSLAASCSGLTAVMFCWLLIGVKGTGVIMGPLLYFWANLFLHGCRPVS